MKGSIEQGMADRLKVARALTRLKHSLKADHELNETLDEIKKAYLKKVQQGKLPDPISLDKVLGA